VFCPFKALHNNAVHLHFYLEGGVTMNVIDDYGVWGISYHDWDYIPDVKIGEGTFWVRQGTPSGNFVQFELTRTEKISETLHLEYGLRTVDSLINPLYPCVTQEVFA